MRASPQLTAAAKARSPASLLHNNQPLVCPHHDARRSVIAHDSSVRRSKQYIARKELQKRAKQDYLRRIYETADRVEDDNLVFELQPSSPRVCSELQESDQHAALNRQLAQQIPALSSWQEVQEFVQAHAERLNFLNVVALVTQAAAVQQELCEAAASQQQQQASTTAADTATLLQAAAPDPAFITQLAVLLLRHSSWFQPKHFAATAVALCDLGVSDGAVWDNLTAAAEHKVGAFTFPQLAATLEALAAAGYTPRLSWVERTYRQAGRHLHAADPSDIAVLMGAWGEMGYTPRDKLFLNQVKILTRRAFDQDQLSASELVQLMHGLARMPRYAPNQGWLAALAKASQQQLQELTPGGMCDLLLSFVALDFSPPEQWMDAVLARLQDSMQQQQQQQQETGAVSKPDSKQQQQQQQQQQEQLLFLPPLDQQQAALQQQLQSPGVLLDTPGLVAGAAGSPQQLPVDPSELQQLQSLFDEADAVGAADRTTDSAMQQQEADAAAGVSSSPPTARLSSRDSSSFEALSLRHQLLQPQLAPEHLGVLCWCLGRLQFQPPEAFMQRLGQVLLAAGPQLSQEVLLDVLQGCVATGYLPVGQLQETLLLQVLQSVPSMPAEGLRRTCQALTGLKAGLQQYAQNPAALLALVPATQQQQQQQQQLGGTGSGIDAPLQQLKAEVAAAIINRQGVVLHGSSTAQIAEVLAFAAAAGQTPSLEYMSAAVARAVNRLPDGCPTPAVCTLLWALARMGFKPHPQLLHQLLAVLQRGLHLLSSTDLADAGWALCTLRHRPGNAWLSLYLREVVSKAPYMTAQGLTDTLWALACFAAQPDREWLKKVVQAAGGLASSQALSRQNAAVMVWALQQMGLQPQQIFAGRGGGGGQGGADTQGGGAILSLAQLVVQQA